MRCGARFVVCALAPLTLLVGCEQPAAERSETRVAAVADAVQRPNPAAIRCVELGGTSARERGPSGGEYGVCFLKDNRQCEEWALLRGECASQGVKVTGYVTPAARYCAITGGAYAVIDKSGTVDEVGSCATSSGTVCDAREHFAGACR